MNRHESPGAFIGVVSLVREEGWKPGARSSRLSSPQGVALAPITRLERRGRGRYMAAGPPRDRSESGQAGVHARY